MENDIVSGQQSAWVLLKKLGEGDAGEVYLVESLLEKRLAILKRPGKSAFAGDVIRQTAQITNEAKILKGLTAFFELEPHLPVRVPRLMDQSKPGTAFSERLFIIIEKATGYDLATLARVQHLGSLSGVDLNAETPEEQRFLQVLSETAAVGEFSDRILLSVLYHLFETFERIHTYPFDLEGLNVSGVLWNDVKPEHLYWDPLRAKLTIIDWGNGQFLEKDGATRDRHFNVLDDYRQLIEAMGRFFETSAPGLLRRLDWPVHLAPGLIDAELIEALRLRVFGVLQHELAGLGEARRREMEFLRGGVTAESLRHAPLAQLDALHQRIIAYGELPDFAGGLYFAQECARQFAAEGLFEEVQQACEWASQQPASRPESLRLIARLGYMASRASDETQRMALGQAVQAALRHGWSEVLWNLTLALNGAPEPEWWPELIETIRAAAAQEEGRNGAVSPLPLLLMRRAVLTLQALLERGRDRGEKNDRLLLLIHHLQEEILPAWQLLDPDPPFSALGYGDVDEILDELGEWIPEARYLLDRALEVPRHQVAQVLQAWQAQDFAAASAGLRLALLEDPDRRRVLRAGDALLAAPRWLARARGGPGEHEHYRAFVTDLEYEGRELRNQVGSAAWLERMLEGCRQLRRGVWPPDLFTHLPELAEAMPWLARFERRERLPAVLQSLLPAQDVMPNFAPLLGVHEDKIGLEYALHLSAPLDGWIAEARGSSARVFGGTLRDRRLEGIPAAIKVMRMDKVDYALPLFREEVAVLRALDGIPGVTPLWECGFLRLTGEGQLPAERDTRGMPELAGNLLRIGPNAAQEFMYQIEQRVENGEIPYLALPLCDPRDNLLTLCDAGMTGGEFRPVSETLLMAIQICDVLVEAHQRNVVYRDHKILHYYWLEGPRGIWMIDWNVARLHPEGLSEYDRQMDLVQFGARALHHILTGRTAPGALPLGPTRPEEIEQAAQHYQAQWTYDDRRLPDDLRSVIERALAADYTHAQDLRDDLKQSFLNLQEEL